MKLPQKGKKKIKMNWQNIKTIAQFDDIYNNVQISNDNAGGRGDHHHSTKYSNHKCIDELNTPKPNTSTSLLIESLIHLLCRVLENDTNLADESYKAICEQLKKINLIDDSYMMNEFEEMRGQYQMQIYKIICAVRGQDIPITLPSSVGNHNSKSVETCWSRYHREFDEISYIAGGGFGKVYKARHKLDSIEYAVKQIKINSTTIKLCHLAEVKTIASLNHPNIVQYKAAWLEPFVPKNVKNEIKSAHNATTSIISSSDTTQDTERTEKSEESYSDTTSSGHNPKFNANNNDESSDFIEFERNSEEKTDFNDSTGKENSQSNNQIICKFKSNGSIKCSQQKPNLAILYIQMSLCQITLQKWLKDRNASCTFDEYYKNFFCGGSSMIDSPLSHIDIVNDIFCQILSGLNYIHSRDIVHHDIKPSNIFLGLENDGKLSVQLGDFGLACPLQNHRGIPLGTPLYAAPEQLDGECNPKSDIYSLGIVLLELLLKFSTDMERSRTIEKARKGTLPTELNKEFAKLVKSLLNDVNTRPTTKDILNVIRAINLEQDLRACNLIKANSQLKDVKIKELKQEIHSLHENAVENETETLRLLKEIEAKDELIRELKMLLHKKDEEITRLSMILEQTKNI